MEVQEILNRKREILVMKNEYSSGRIHKTGGRRNPNKMWNCIFCESTRIWGQTTLVFGTVEINNFTQIRQKILR